MGWACNEADSLKPALAKSIGEAVFLWIEKFGEAGVFLEKGKILVVAGMEAVLGAQLDGDLEIGHRGIGFPSKAIERGQRVVNVIGLRRGFAGSLQALARIIPPANVHHGYAALIMLVGGAGVLLGARLHALLGDIDVHAGAVGKPFTGSFKNFFQFLLGFGKSLLVKERQRLIVNFELRLNAGIDELDASALGRRRRI